MKGRKIELKECFVESIDVTDEEGKTVHPKFEYRNVLLESLNSPKLNMQGMNEGLDFKDIEKRLKLKEELDKSKDTLIIPEDEYSMLVGLVEKMKWKVLDNIVVQFTKDVQNAEKVELEEKKQG